MAVLGIGRRDKTAEMNSTPRPIAASAHRVSITDRNEIEAMRNRLSNSAIWQADAWIAYDNVGEIKFAFNLVANLVSRLRLFPAVVLDPSVPPVEVVDASTADPELTEEQQERINRTAERALDGLISEELATECRRQMSLLDANAGLSALQRGFALNLQVPGECYMALIEGKWRVVSTDELKIDAASNIRWIPLASQNSQGQLLDKSTPIGRVWRAHPRHSFEADGSLRALRSDVEELLLLSRMIRTNARARMNAGILFVPDSIEVAAQSVAEDSEVEDEDSFMTELISSMTAAVADEDSAAAIVPLVVRGPAEAGKDINHVTLNSDSDSKLVDRAERVLERILQGLDVPKDVVTGLANVKYSNAVQIDENMYKAHVEPLGMLICDAITEIYLRPMLRAAGFKAEEVNRIVVWYDASEVVTRPDRGSDADRGYDNFLISGRAWRRAHSFTESDKPDEQELAKRIALEKTQIPQEIVTVLVSALLPTLMGEATKSGAATLPEGLQQELGDLSQPPVPPAVEG